MRKTLLFAFSFIPFFCTAQTISDDQLMINAAEEGMNNVQITNLVDYFHTKGNLQPSHRNSVPVYGQTMGNPGFENDNFWGWSGYIGDNQTSRFAPLSNIQNGIFTAGDDAPLSNSTARHTIVSTASDTDYFGGFPVVYSGNYSCRLGGETPNYQAEELAQTWNVDPGTPYIKVSYAVVLNSPPSGHLQSAIPFFYYTLEDAAGNTIVTDTIVADDPSLILSAQSSPALGDAVNYCSWRTDSISLLPYIGQNVKLSFLVAGCTQSGHFGYAYVDTDYPYPNSIGETNLASFSISPNPAVDHVDLKGKIRSSNDITVVDLPGQPVGFSAMKIENGWRLDVSGLKPGIYFISVRNGSSTSIQKILINGNN